MAFLSPPPPGKAVQGRDQEEGSSVLRWHTVRNWLGASIDADNGPSQRHWDSIRKIVHETDAA